MIGDIYDRLAVANENERLLGIELAAKYAEIAALRKALEQMVYETTHLSPMKDDGSHWCKISGMALAAARAALEMSGGVK